MPKKLILLVALVEIELLIRAIHPKQRDKKEKQIWLQQKSNRPLVTPNSLELLSREALARGAFIRICG